MCISEKYTDRHANRREFNDDLTMRTIFDLQEFQILRLSMFRGLCRRIRVLCVCVCVRVRRAQRVIWLSVCLPVDCGKWKFACVYTCMHTRTQIHSRCHIRPPTPTKSQKSSIIWLPFHISFIRAPFFGAVLSPSHCLSVSLTHRHIRNGNHMAQFLSRTRVVEFSNKARTFAPPACCRRFS